MPELEAQVTPETEQPVVEEPAAVEPPVEEPAAAEDVQEEEQPELDDYDQRMAKLMARSRENYKVQQELKAKQEKLERAERLDRLAKENPEALFRELGVKQPQIDIDAILGKEDDGEPKAVKEVRSTVDALQKRIDELEGRAKQRAEQEQQRAFEDWSAKERASIDAHITSKAEDYPLLNSIKEMGANNDVFKFMMDHYNKTGDIMTYDEAAGVIESYWDKTLKLLAKTEKAKRLLNPTPQANGKSGKGKSKTLTNQLSAESAADIDPDTLSEEENRKFAFAQAQAAIERAKAQQQS